MSTSPKREVFENLARVGTALSSPVRIEFLELLAQTERTVEQLAAMTGASVANTSQHLQKLRLDVRPPEEYAAGHVPGAINIPVHELQERLHDLRKRKEVIAYRRGAYCLMSYDALQDGLPEWRAAGLPVE